MEDEKQFRKRLAAAENMAVRYRKYRRARERALTRISQKYKEEYLDFLAEEKEKDEQEGAGRYYITPDGFDIRLVPTDRATDTDRGDTSDIPQDKGDNE